MSERLAENRLIMTTPLILGIASFIVFGIYFWSCNHAPYNYTEIIFAGPVLSLIGVIISIITCRSRKEYPMLWGCGVFSCLIGFVICVFVICLLIAIFIAASKGEWL